MRVTISSQVIDRIDAAFTSPHCDRLVGALLAAYTTACDNWKPDEGSISQTFGYDAWAFGNFRLRELADDATLGFVPEIHEGRFTLRKDGLFLSSYKAGSSRDADIWRSFPKNQHAAPQLARNNSQLDIFLDGDPSPDAPVDLVLAHLGNPERGLEAVYLCVPTAVENERISEWGFAQRLWRRGDSGLAERPVSPVAPPEPSVPIDEPAIRLRVDRQTSRE